MPAKTKEVTVLEAAPLTIETAKSLRITDEASMSVAVDVLSKLNTAAKSIKAERELITKPMNEALAEVRGRYKPTEDALAEAIASVRKTMTTYQTEQDRLAAIEKKKIDDKVAAGRLKTETGMAKREAIVEAPTKVVAASGKVAFKPVECFEVTNLASVPVDYILPNETAIRNAMKAGVKIAGVRYYTEQRPINRTA